MSTYLLRVHSIIRHRSFIQVWWFVIMQSDSFQMKGGVRNEPIFLATRRPLQITPSVRYPCVTLRPSAYRPFRLLVCWTFCFLSSRSWPISFLQFKSTCCHFAFIFSLVIFFFNADLFQNNLEKKSDFQSFYFKY